MQLPIFFEPAINSKLTSFILSEETTRHCLQVLRMKKDEQLQLTDGIGSLITASILNADKKNCEVKFVNTEYFTANQKKISVAISILKNPNRFEWFLEKAVEIGVSEIIPLICARTEKQHFRFERMQSIIIAAMLQSRQVWLPKLIAPTTFADAVSSSTYEKKFIAHCIESEKHMLTDFDENNNAQILIGPEGDFTTDEVILALNKNYIAVTLGNTRLRTETAGIVASALLMHI